MKNTAVESSAVPTHALAWHGDGDGVAIEKAFVPAAAATAAADVASGAKTQAEPATSRNFFVDTMVAVGFLPARLLARDSNNHGERKKHKTNTNASK